MTFAMGFLAGAACGLIAGVLLAMGCAWLVWRDDEDPNIQDRRFRSKTPQNASEECDESSR